jgi:hypothetical protein
MIPYADFERAVSRWKIRQSGGHVSASTEESSGAVVAEVAAPNAELASADQDPDRTPMPEDVNKQFALPTDGE